MISIRGNQKDTALEELLNVLATEIFKIYHWKGNEKDKYFLTGLLNPSLRGMFSKILIEQITVVSKKEE